MKVEGKTAIASGGASGIGAALAERPVARGANVVIADINEVAKRYEVNTVIASVMSEMGGDAK